MADKYQKYAAKYGLTPNQVKAMINIIANEINCDECLEFIIVSEEEPEQPKKGDAWFNPDDGSLNIYDGEDWQEIGLGARPESSCCPADNGLTLTGDTYYLGGELVENTTIESYGETFQIIYNPTGTDTYSINFIEPVSGLNMFVAGYADSGSGGTNFKSLLALSSAVGLTASDDNTIQYTAITSFDSHANLTYTDVTGSGADNSSVNVSKGLVTLDAPVIFLDGELISLDASSDIVMESQQNLKITSEDTSGTDSKVIDIRTGDNANGNTGSILIVAGSATTGNGGNVEITSGKSFTSGNGGNIVLKPSAGGTNNGRVLIQNLPTFADDAAAGVGGLIADMVYKTASGELRIKI